MLCLFWTLFWFITEAPEKVKFMSCHCCPIVTDAECFAEMDSRGVGSQHSSVYVDISLGDYYEKANLFHRKHEPGLITIIWY